MYDKIKRLKWACYTTNVSMSVVATLSPILFITLRSTYGISYTLLGLLVLINFSTQLIVDLVFSFFSYRFNISKCVKITPFLTVVGFALYAVLPWLFPNYAYLGILLGTLVFSASSGLAEVLISPVIAAIPSKDPDREMSKLHSIYAWGVVGVIVFATVFLQIFGYDKWQILTLVFSVIPLCSFSLFLSTDIPEMKTERVSGVVKLLKSKWLWACVIAIFLGGATECTMGQWSSSYLEQVLGISKVWGDIFGVALFGVMLGLGRTLYSKIGKNVTRVLLFGAIGATACYLTAAFSNFALLGLAACALTGLCSSMLWPGSLIVASDRFKDGGVFIFAMMAAGGDLGASIGPQLIGLITDGCTNNPKIISLAAELSLLPEQLGMKLGMAVGSLFPIFAIPVYFIIHKRLSK